MFIQTEYKTKQQQKLWNISMRNYVMGNHDNYNKDDVRIEYVYTIQFMINVTDRNRELKETIC